MVRPLNSLINNFKKNIYSKQNRKERETRGTFPNIQLLQFCCPRNKVNQQIRITRGVDEKSDPARLKYEDPEPIKNL